MLNENAFLPMQEEVPIALLPWLTHQDSLTERLQARHSEVSLQVLREVWEKVNWWDRWLLGLTDTPVMHREIMMRAGKEACWYARSIIPKTTYQADTAFFNRLKQESLGKLLFNEKKIKRVLLQHYAINAHTLEYHWVGRWLPISEPVLWARLSIFSLLEAFPIFLVEILLPEVARYTP